MARVSLSTKEKMNLISNIGTMLTAGIPIYEATQVLLDEAKGGTKLVLEELQKDLAAGKSINMSFANFPDVFDEVTVNLIKAAEEAGTLEQTLKDLVVTMRKEMEFSERVTAAMMYPMIIMVVFIGVVLMMLMVVIPKISKVFERMNVNLPLPTRIMVAASKALLENTYYVVGGIILLIVVVVFLYKRNKKLIFNIVFSMPGIRGLVRQIDITRFCRSLHLLLSSGVPITHSLALAQKVVMKKEVERIIEKARVLAESGHQFSEGLRTKDKIFPPMMVKLMEVGERTGQLENSMLHVSEQMDYEVSKTLKSLTALIEPIMLVFIGVAVGGMMMGIISPIYGLIGNVGA